MAAGEGRQFIGRFAYWFEQRYPKERYKLKKSDEGYYIVRANDTIITYCDYYAAEVLGELAYETGSQIN